MITTAEKKRNLRQLLDARACGPFNWKADVHTLTTSQRVELAGMAKATGYRKGVSSSLSLGAAFFVYLCKGMDATPAAAKQPGKRWDNDGLAK